MAEKLRKDIENLASEENAAARGVAAQLGPIEDPERWDYLAQQVLLAPRGRENPNVAADDGLWGCAVDEVPLLRQLLIYPSLIVDLRPYKGETDLINSFGLTLNQLLRLADAGHILLNVYEFESQRGKKFEAYIGSPGIEKILKHPNCRIHSIRREQFFRSIAVPEEIRSATRRSARAFFEEQIVRLSQQHPDHLESLTRCRDVEGALAVVTEAYLYLEVFGSDRPEVRAWLSALPRQITTSSINQILVELLGIKLMLANPYTAAFGGFSTYTEQRIERMAKASWVLATQPEKRRVVDPIFDTGLRYIQSILKQLDVTDDINTQVPSTITDRDLNNFLGLLRDHSEVQNEALRFLEQVRASVGDDQSTLSTLEGWAKAVAQVRRAYDRIKWLSTRSGTLVGGVAGYGVGVLTGGDFSTLKILLAAAGAVFGIEIENRSEEFLLAKLLTQNKCQIVDRLNKFQEWAQ